MLVEFNIFIYVFTINDDGTRVKRVVSDICFNCKERTSLQNDFNLKENSDFIYLYR